MITVPLTKGYVAVVDDDACDIVASRSWHAAVGGDGRVYAAGRRPGGRGSPIERLHRLLVGATAGQLVDHRNGDTLDDRKSNLRITSATGNARNTCRHRGNASGLKGVYYDAARAKWQAQICADGRKTALGRFATAEEAARAYDAAALALHGEFARLNFPAVR